MRKDTKRVTNNSPAPADFVVVDYTEIYPRLTTIGAQPLERLSVRDLWILFKAYKRTHDVFLEAGRLHDEAEAVVSCITEAERDRCDHAMSTIVEEILQRSPTDSAERDFKGEVLIMWGLYWNDDDSIDRGVAVMRRASCSRARNVQ
jgi:hypothetical protein